MNILNLRKVEFEKLIKLNNPGINHMESELYLIPFKLNSVKKYKLFKKFKNISKQELKIKIEIITELISQQENINIEQLILPIELVAIDGIICGYTMKFIDNNLNISQILSNDKIDNKFKIEVLKQIGILLEKIKYNKILSLTDIHEGNFLYAEKTVYGIDLDGSRINNKQSSISKYLSENTRLFNFPHKYPLENNVFVANKDTMNLSYIYMILNFISGCNYIFEISIEQYYKYLQYLKDQKFNRELIDIFTLVYTNANNQNPVNLLDTLPKNLKKISPRGIIF